MVHVNVTFGLIAVGLAEAKATYETCRTIMFYTLPSRAAVSFICIDHDLATGSLSILGCARDFFRDQCGMP